MTDAGKEGAVDLLRAALQEERAWHERQWDFALDDARECSHRKEEADERLAMDRANNHHHRLSAIDAALRQAASGNDKLAGYEGEAEVNNSLPTQGGGAGDRETVQRLVMAELWASEQYNGVGPDYDSYRINGKHPMGGRVEAYEKRAKKLTDAILSALQAAPSEGGEPFGYWVEHKLAEPVFLRPPAYIPSGPNYTVTPVFARPPVPGEGGEPVAWQRVWTYGDGAFDRPTLEPYDENQMETLNAATEVLQRPLFARPPAPSEPVEVTIFCPACSVPHVDEGEWATTRHHKTHQCQSCGHEWRPFPFATVGVAPPAPSEEPLVGWKLVPVEASAKMLKAMDTNNAGYGMGLGANFLRDVWANALAAAPAPDAIRGGEG